MYYLSSAKLNLTKWSWVLKDFLQRNQELMMRIKMQCKHTLRKIAGLPSLPCMSFLDSHPLSLMMTKCNYTLILADNVGNIP